MRMKTNIFKALSLFAAALLLTATSCTKEDNGGAEEPLEVNRNNISGSWELVSWNGKPLEGGTYLHLTLVRNDATFTLEQNLDSFGDIPQTLTGRYSLSEDEIRGSIIEGLYDHDYGFWSHKYVISALYRDTMVWTALDDENEVQVFQRLQ